MKKKVIVTVMSVLAITACVGIVSAYGLPELNKNTNKVDSLTDKCDDSKLKGFCTDEERKRIQDEKEQIFKQLEKKAKNGEIDSSDEMTDDEFAELDKKFAKADEEAEKLDKRDLKAYPIIAKYLGEEYRRNELISDYNLDIDYMEKMCELYNSDKPTEEEKEILYNYVDRRTAWIEDRDLRHHFVNEIGAPY